MQKIAVLFAQSHRAIQIHFRTRELTEPLKNEADHEQRNNDGLISIVANPIRFGNGLFEALRGLDVQTFSM